MTDLNKMLKNRKADASQVQYGSVENVVGVIKEIEIAKVKEDPMQPRKTFNQESITSLAESIKEKGLLSPIIVKPDGSSYLIIAGHRRIKALQMLNAKNAPCIVKEQPLSREELTVLQLIENIQREDIPPVEKAESIFNLSKEGMKQTTIAKQLGYSEGMVSRYIQVYAQIQKAPAFAKKVNSLGVEKAYTQFCMEKNKNSKAKSDVLSFSITIKDKKDAKAVTLAINKVEAFLVTLKNL